MTTPDTRISSLSGSAARLLLAFLTTHSKENIDGIIARSGIRSLATYDKAMKELVENGYYYTEDDKSYVKLFVADAQPVKRVFDTTE